MRMLHGRRSRPGLSEIVGAVLTIALTIIAGGVVFSYVNGEAKVSELSLGQSVGATNSFLNEQFNVVNVNFTTSALSMWFYNYGGVNLQPIQVQIYTGSKSVFVQFNATKVTNLNSPSGCNVAATTSYESPILYNSRKGASNPSGVVNIAQGAVAKITLTFPSCISSTYTSGTTYYMNVVGLYGNAVTYYQTR